MEINYHIYYAPRIKKNGKPGAWIEHRAPYSPLRCCDVCGVLWPARKVTYRSDVHAWNWQRKDEYGTPSKDMLCVGCWNKARAVKQRQRAVDENKSLINLINKEIRNGRKQREQDGSDHGRPAGLPGEHDGRREERHA